MKRSFLIPALCLLFVISCGSGSKKDNDNGQQPDKTNDVNEVENDSDEIESDTDAVENDTDETVEPADQDETDDEEAFVRECEENETKADCADGKYSRCNGGRWKKVTCPNEASCTTEGTCGECKDGDSLQCENNNLDIGEYYPCENGKWSEEKKECEDELGPVSCTTEHKCGECWNDINRNCKEISGIATADICIDGILKKVSCKALRGTDVSCNKFCADGREECDDSEKASVCGLCTNGKFLCLTQDNPYNYDLPSNYIEALASCENGHITDSTLKPCKQNTCNPDTGACEPPAN